MISLIEYAQFGVAIFSIGALVFCIKEFLKFMTKQEESFKNTIDNHLHEAKELSNRQLKASENLNKAVEELLTYLRYHNGTYKRGLESEKK